MTLKWYVYQLRAENEDLPFYIGKGQGNRMWQHACDARRGGKSLKHSKIRKYLRNGIRVIAEKIFESSSEQECFDIERQMISKYGRRDIGTGILANQTNGGEGASGFVPSEELRARKSAQMKGRIRSQEHCASISSSQKGHSVSKEAREKISKSLSGRSLTLDHVRRSADARRGHTHSDETRKKISDRNKGKVISDEQRKAISAALKGKTRNALSVDKGAKYPREQAYLHVKSQIESGMSQKEYCLANGIKEQTFCGWKRSSFVIQLAEQDGVTIWRRNQNLE